MWPDLERYNQSIVAAFRRARQGVAFFARISAPPAYRPDRGEPAFAAGGAARMRKSAAAWIPLKIRIEWGSKIGLSRHPANCEATRTPGKAF